MERPFERVVLVDGAVKRSMTYDEFVALPLHERVQHLMNRATEFYIGEAQVDRRVVLRSLMRAPD